MSRYEFESRSSKAPQALVWGFVKLDALRATPARLKCYADGDDVAAISILGAGGEPAASGSTVYITMYRLPAGDRAFAAELKLIASAEKPWPLPRGGAFDQAMLAPANLPAHWRHKAVQVEDANRGIVHAYRGKSRAMIIHYEQRRGDVLLDELFTWTAKNVSVIDGAWLLDPPVATRDDENYS